MVRQREDDALPSSPSPTASPTESEATFRALVERASDLLAIVDAQGTIRYVSPSAEGMLGYAAHEVVGRGMLGFLHPEDLEAGRMAFERAVAQPGTGPVLTVRFRHRDGSWRQLEASTSNGIDDPEVAGVIVHARDITDRRVLEHQLRQIQKREALGQLTSGIAHDFNNILSIIMANADLIADAIPPEQAQARRDLADIQGSARSGAEMIKKLLGYTRQADVVPTLLDLRQVVEDLAGLLRRLLPERIEVAVAPGDAPGLVRVDPTSVEQIVFNLATNARDAMESGGTFTLGVEQVTFDERFCHDHPGARPGEYVRLEARDTGSGMDEAMLQKVFEPFFTTKEPGKGTGLGTSMIYGLVKQYRGYVHVESEPGTGTTVRIYFPLVTEGRPARRTRFSLPAVRAGSETVLFIEDNDALRRAGTRALETFGYRVIAVADGEAALNTFDERRTEIDLVVSDVVLPKVDGKEVYRRIRAREPRMRFVFTSGYAAEEVRKDLRFADDVLFLHKPWTVQDLARTVREALDAVPLSP